MLSKLLIKVIK